MEYPATLARDDDTWLVSFPDFPEVHTFGSDETDALAHGRDALATILDAYIADGRAIPQPSTRRTKYRIAVPALIEAKVGLYTAMRDRHINKAELGRRLKVHPPQVDRLLAMTHGSQLAQLEAAFAVLGKRIEIHVSDTGARRDGWIARKTHAARSDTADSAPRRQQPARMAAAARRTTRAPGR